MRTLDQNGFAAARRYLSLNARLLERRRFDVVFGDGPREPVLHVLRGYQNPDGGFGHALEPDLRGDGSQPQPAELALWILDEVGGFDDAMVARLGDWLAANSGDDGGVPFVLPSVTDTPRAPWWQPDQGPDGRAISAINPTGPIAGLLGEHGVEHPWLARATEFCWRTIAELDDISAYDALATLAFLERAADRQRAEAEFDRLADALLATVALDPDAEGHVHSPLDFAPRPDAMARRLFRQADVDRHLDVLVDRQQDDGSWAPNFLMWTPVVATEWGGWLTLSTLKTLRAYGRVDGV
ncbi:hypothetical protein [Stackebrandtia nassauensis]|uniref:Prenyltransferase/squalene oxidase n=1 Tax=Stackebrandtia nassauensis (strain DSM 44728 / CIP 108903 / NRRL B-16338 / NBRC 102104 / LLR-40K-21) TaxID=446470 RepID=D3QAS7_STANL|nr:hypothetical protein [Stackebrandtia nassauensis]ADD44723.1 hypothetical protein Snas_5087 [Stackebrandtia nassauensis DSM 44728]